MSRFPCSRNIGAGLNTANFTNTIFDDSAALPIQNASAPFSATYQVQTGLGPGGKTVTLGSLSGRSAKATYILADQQHIVGAHRHGPAQQLVDLDGPAGADATAWASRSPTSRRSPSGSS